MVKRNNNKSFVGVIHNSFVSSDGTVVVNNINDQAFLPLLGRGCPQDRRGFENAHIKTAAFTLAEVLITLGIIGVVAAMTIPGLMSKYTERQNIVKLQRVYALLQQATRSMVAENGELNTWADDSREFYISELSKQLKVVRYCSQASVCSSAMTYQYPAIVLIDGTVIGIFRRKPNSSVGGSYHICKAPVSAATDNFSGYYYNCVELKVDLNGKGKPNRFGEDAFDFRVWSDGVSPYGLPIKNNTIDNTLKPCLQNRGGSEACTAWVIKNKNMDYLHCPEDLSWGGNKTCPKK